MADPYLSFLPPALRAEVEHVGVMFALNMTFLHTLEYIPQHFYDLVRARRPTHGGLYWVNSAHSLTDTSSTCNTGYNWRAGKCVCRLALLSHMCAAPP
jgi:hypothetical protein